jgi:hypothetical protein
MDAKVHHINLTRKRKAPNGHWQFYPVHWAGSKPNPRVVIVEDGPTSWKEGGAYFIDWRVDGKRVRSKVGEAPCEILGAWQKVMAVAEGCPPQAKPRRRGQHHTEKFQTRKR